MPAEKFLLLAYQAQGQATQGRDLSTLAPCCKASSALPLRHRITRSSAYVTMREPRLCSSPLKMLISRVVDSKPPTVTSTRAAFPNPPYLVNPDRLANPSPRLCWINTQVAAVKCLDAKR
jgi:hypothetical protein